MATFELIHTQNDQLDRIQQNVSQAVSDLSQTESLSFVTALQKSYTATGKEDVIFMNNTSDVSVTLPVTMSPKRLTIKSIGKGSVTVKCIQPKVLIDGKSSVSIDSLGSLTVVFTLSSYWSVT